MQLQMRLSWPKATADLHVTWRLMDRSDLRRTPRLDTEVEGRIKAPQTLNSSVSRWRNRLQVANHWRSVRLLGAESQSFRWHPFGYPLNTNILGHFKYSEDCPVVYHDSAVVQCNRKQKTIYLRL